jgi:hypothetical protein
MDPSDGVDHFLARMAVAGRQGARREIDAHLDELAPGRSEIVPLQTGPRNAWDLRQCHVQCQTAPCHQQCGDAEAVL